jgi:hypothetical protein
MKLIHNGTVMRMYTGFTSRRAEMRKAYNILFGKPRGKRIPGRSRTGATAQASQAAALDGMISEAEHSETQW